MSDKHNYHILILLTILLAFTNSCSVEKNTRLSRAYHNLTAKYNVGFNGKESFLKGKEKIESEFVDDYTRILPVFYYKNEDALTSAVSDMERTITKCTKLISQHSITAKPKVKESKDLTPKQRDFLSKKEYNLYVDDAYILMGKAHFYKREFDLASEIFRLLLNDFKNQPVTYEAQIWLCRVMIETGQLKEASDILVRLDNDTGYPDKLLSELYATYADFNLQQNDYLLAIEYLEKALESVKIKKLKIRYTYILAQLYEKTGDLKQSSDYYGSVIKMNPKYEMSFNARINRALAYEQGFGYADDIENELIKMLKDDKNIEFQDQIYFALGNLVSKEGEKEKAFEYYNKSIQVNVNNDQQKARSYLIIADLYYNIPDYPYAQAYYDSTLVYISDDYTDYDLLLSKARNLTRLVEEIKTVETADSLIVLSMLSDNERYERIDAIIENERIKEELIRQKQLEDQRDQQFENEMAVRNRLQQQSASEGSKWYFYNDAAKSLGYNEFKLKWGNRKLEDHWQREEKSMISFTQSTANMEEEENSDSAESEEPLSKFTREYYLKDIPQTDIEVNELKVQIEMALYNMGLIYKNDLNDADKASESFKELINRFPESQYLLSTYYNMYMINKNLNNQALVEYYTNIIIQQFPESMYAKVLTNPEYFKELEEEEKAVANYYEETYNAYKNENYSDAINRSDYALDNYKDSPLIPQFAYIKVLAQAKELNRNAFREKLSAFIDDYPNTEVAQDAQNIIDYIDNEHPEIKIAAETTQSLRLYSYNPDEAHYFAYIFNKNINSNQLVFNIINFNLDFYDDLNLIVEIEQVNTTQNMLLVRRFDDIQKVMQYLQRITDYDGIYNDLPDIPLTATAISESNLNILRNDKSSDRYLLFFNENYQ